MTLASPNPLRGRGRELLLPAAGNPFGEPEAALPPVPAGFGEPRDLTPEDLAAMFPSNDMARNQLPAPAAIGGGSPLPSAAATPQDISADVLRGEPAMFADGNPFAQGSAAAASAAATEAGAAHAANPFSSLPLSGSADPQTSQAGLSAVPADLDQLSAAIQNLQQQLSQARSAGTAKPEASVKPSLARQPQVSVASRNLKAAASEAAVELDVDVELRRAQGRRLVRWVLTRGLPILSFAILWLGALAWLWQATQRAVPPQVTMFQLPLLEVLRGALLGSFGGTLATIYSVWIHTARRRDFDRFPQLWYLAKPWAGGIFGCVAPVLFWAILQAFPEVPGWNSPLVLAINSAALLLGFLQDRIFYRIGKILRVFGG